VTERVHVERVKVSVRGGSPRASRALAAELRGALRPALVAELLRPDANRPTRPPVTAVARAVVDGIRGAQP
jgi:hypothetical protein